MENNLDNVEKDNNSVQEKNKNSALLTILCSVISSSIIASSFAIYLNVVIGRKLDKISANLSELDKNINDTSDRISNDLEDIHQELDSMNNRLNNIIDSLDNQSQNLDNINNHLDNIIDSLENQSQNIANELNDPTQKYPLGQERFKDKIIKEDNMDIHGSYGDTILVNDNASIYALPDLATPLTPYYQNSDMQRVIGGAIMMDENQNSYVAMTEEDMADLTSKGYTVYGYLALNEYSQNAYDYEGIYLASDVTVLDKNIYQTRSLHR